MRLLAAAAAPGRGSRSPTCTAPGAGAAGVITALGAGLAVLTMVALIERNLAAEIDLRLPERVPSLFLIDLQKDQQKTRSSGWWPGPRGRRSCRARR